MKQLVFCNTVFVYSHFELLFEIYPDVSNYQLGAMIVQNNRPIAFFSRKLSSTQQRNTIIVKKLLGLIKTLQEFKGIILNQKIEGCSICKTFEQDALGLDSDHAIR